MNDPILQIRRMRLDAENPDRDCIEGIELLRKWLRALHINVVIGHDAAQDMTQDEIARQLGEHPREHERFTMVAPTPKVSTLGQRAVSCKHWKWLPGMRASVSDIGHRRLVTICYGARVPPDSVPDLDDPATLGCLQRLCEEAHGVPLNAYVCRAGGWLVESAHDHGGSLATDVISSTREEAWVHCLEIAR